MSNDPVETMFSAVPDIGSNVVGIATKAALLSRMEGATPGSHTQPWPQSSGPTFLKLFFPGYTQAAYTANVTPCTQLNDGFWSGFAVATLCQAMYNITFNLRGQLKSQDIDNAVNGANAQITNQAMPLYGLVLQQGFAPFAQAYNDTPDKNQACAQYSAQLQSHNYLNALAVQYHGQGGLPNFDWLLWHHWVKLHVLGMSNDSINSVITTVKNTLQGLQVALPANVDTGVWLQYNTWMSTNDPTRRRLDWNDIAGSARSGILARVCMSTGSPYPSCMNEENSFEFTANGQPGSGYRSSGGGCCFAAGTQVLLADGRSVAIEELQPGELLATPAGPRRVALVARPFRAGRALFGINGLPLRFTATHPLLQLDEAQQPQLACVEPMTLSGRIPGLARRGIGQLAPGGTLARYVNGALTPYTLDQLIRIDSPEDYHERLYDVLLEPDAQGNAYLVGGDEVFFATESEVPGILGYADTAAFFLALTQQIHQALEEPFAGLSQQQCVPLLERLVVGIMSEVLPAAMADSQNSSVMLTEMMAPLDVEAATLSFFEQLSTSSSTSLNSLVGAEPFNWQLNLLIEHLLTHLGERLLAVLAMGWRVAGRPQGSILAVTLIDVSLFGGASFEELPLEVGITINGHRHPLTQAQDRPSTAFTRHVDQVLYCSPGELPEYLIVDCQESTATKLIAQVFLPARIDSGWRATEGLLRNAEGEILGTCSLDLRLLDEEAVQREQQSRRGWSLEKAEESRQALFHILAQKLPAHLQSIGALVSQGRG